jgi:hypothetical protein
MDLIYLILSVFLRRLPVARKRFVGTGFSSHVRDRDRMELAFWIPMVGWISVSVQQVAEARWLPWRVRDIYSLGQPSLNRRQKRGRKHGSGRHGRRLPPRVESPD